MSPEKSKKSKKTAKVAKRKKSKKPSSKSKSIESSPFLASDGGIDQLTEEQLRLLSSMVKQCTEGMALVDLEGHIQFINHAFAGMHGYTPDELIGQSLAIFHNEEQLPSVLEANETIQKTGEFIGEIWHKHRDGSVFPTFMNNSMLRDESGQPIGMIGTLRDITLQKQAEDALRESETRYRQLIDNAGNPIMLFDLKNRVLFVNNTSAENFGLKPEEMIGKSIHEFMPDLADEIARRNKKIVSTGIGFEVENHVQLPTAQRWFLTNLQPARDADGNIYGVLVISNDITKLKTSEKMLKKTSEELRIKHIALQEKNVTLKQVLSHIEDGRRDSLFKIKIEIKKAVLPLIKKLREKMGNSYSAEIDSLETSLKVILAQDKDSFNVNFNTLTSRETEISGLIKKSLSSKEISTKLNISLPTVFKHREQIRKKLEITNKNISLAAFLRSHQ